ncbi:MAG TPA: putative lipid II flippase FtsW [Actinomycetota bacterium]|nr:putative lipid II flippase FtsW [Actinomycetota bacterium]
MATRQGVVGVRARSRAPAQTLGRGHPAVLLSVSVGSLLVLGLVMILSASSVTSFATYDSSFFFFKRQLVCAIIGAGAFIFFARLDYRKLSGSGYLLFAGTCALLVAVLIPGLGITVGGSARWLGWGPLSFQPSEMAKLAFVLFAADVFSRKDEKLLEGFSHTVLPLMPAMGLLVLLIMKQPDMGTTLVTGAIGLSMLFVAGAPLRFLLPIGLIGVAAASFGALAAPYRRARLLAFMDPWADPLYTGYQTIQSLIALGSGGWFGVGLGASRQKWMYIPNAHTDFIYAILGEETGALGTLVVLGLFAFIAFLGIKIARRAPDRFGMLIASGITVWICFQALVNIGAVTAALPITGVPLPFVSFGGTSLVISLIAMGILTSIALHSKPPRGQKRTARRPASR